MRKIYQILLVFIVAISVSSCGIYTKNLMFQTKDNSPIIGDSILKMVAETKANYILQPSDLIEMKVYTSLGEKIIDPNGEFSAGLVTGIAGVQLQQMQNQAPQFNVRANRTIKLPMVGLVDVAGLTMYQLDSVLQVKYSKFYEDVFVITKCVNRRVLVFGLSGTGSNNSSNNSSAQSGVSGAGSIGSVGVVRGQVVELPYEKMNLLEILAMVGGLDQNAKSYNIKLIRGDLKNPNVEVIDLSTIEGMKKANLNIQPNDIIYVERFRRSGSQILTQITPYISLLTLLTTTILILKR